MKDNALYLEVDEDITSAIDKLQKLSAESVQIVVPKRSTMLQSVINLKLLKKAAADSGKKLVLVTNDKVATSLAGRVGLAVAPSLGAEAVMATAPEPMAAAMEDVIEASDPEPEAPAAVVAPGAAVLAQLAVVVDLDLVGRQHVGRVGDAPGNIFVPGPIFRCGVNKFGGRHIVDIRDLDRQIDSFAHRRLGHAPDVERLPDRRTALGGEQGAGNRVIDIGEAPGLVA